MRKVPFVVTAFVACSALLAAPSPKTADKPERVSVKHGPGEISITSKSPQAIDAFKKGRKLLENIRAAEAAEEFKKAIELDPSFALAHAYLGTSTPGVEGLKHLDHAASLAQGVTPAERTLIDILVAERRGEEEKVRSLRKTLAELAPGDWRAQLQLGQQESFERNWDGAVATLKRAIELNPKAGAAYNTMGYAYLNTGKTDQAIEAFRKYASIMPTEPNPEDSLAEALMAAGRFDEAEASFRKAAEISPRFWNAWEGVAQTKFMRGDWSGGREALAKAKAAASRPLDKIDNDITLAWSQAAEGKTSDALASLDAVDKGAAGAEAGMIHAFAAINSAMILNQAGKLEQAIGQAAAATEKAEKAGLPGGVLNGVRRQALAVRIDAESKLKRGEDAKKTLALIEEEAGKSPANADLQSLVHFARGAEAAARGDEKAAAGHYAQCSDDDYYCRWHHVMALDRSGDTAGAAAARAKLLSANRRDRTYLFVRSKLGAAPAAEAKSSS